MNEGIQEPLTKPKPIRYKKKQWRDLGFVADHNNEVSICHVARVYIDMGLKVTRLNGNQIPLLDQIQLRRVLVRRASRDSKRNK